MKTVVDLIQYDPVWVNPQHRLASAICLMRGHSLSGLPVLDGSKLVGMLLSKDLLGLDPGLLVNQVMDRDFTAVLSTLSLQKAAEIMSHKRIGRLPIVNLQNKLVGVITADELLTELRRSVDPITELPWSDAMREWAGQALQSGHEITVLFIDIDEFGRFNKEYGHVVGDSVLHGVARILAEMIDPERDSLCRYGGDEFCITTTRPAETASLLAEKIERDIQAADLVNKQAGLVSVMVGQYGGKRGREREHTHYAATLNNLINLASQACMRKKRLRETNAAGTSGSTQEQTGPQVGEPIATYPINGHTSPDSTTATRAELTVAGAERLRLARFNVEYAGNHARASVTLERGDARGAELQNRPDGASERAGYSAFTGVADREVGPEGIIHLIAEATMTAVNSAVPQGRSAILDEVLTSQTDGGKPLVTVIGKFGSPDEMRAIVGTVVMNGDPHRAVAAAVLAAVNRQIEALITTHPVMTPAR